MKALFKTLSFWIAIAAIVTSAAGSASFTPHGFLLEGATIALIVALRYVARWGR